MVLPRVLAVAALAGLGATTALAGLPVSTTTSLADLPVATARPALAAARVAEPLATALDVPAENLRPGTRSWRIGRAEGTRPGLAGYAAAVSVSPGEDVPLVVSGQGTVRIRAFRIGWYGGDGARLVWRGTLRAAPGTGPAAGWPARGFADTTGWPPGQYLIRLDLRLDLGTASRYVPLTVRSPQVRDRVVVLSSPLTWQAENPWPASSTATATRARIVSFDRPYVAGYGAGPFLAGGLRIVQLAERTGVNLAYLSDDDVAADPAQLDAPAAVLLAGSSRYWTPQLRTAISQALDGGANLAAFGAGTGSRQVRLLPAESGRRSRSIAVSGRPASTSVRLTGVRPSCLPPADGRGGAPVAGATATGRGARGTGLPSSSIESPAGDWVVADAGWWGFSGAGVRTGEALAGLVGTDPGGADRATAGSPTPLQVLSTSRFTCAGGAKVPQSAVYLARRSGAGVFAAGTDRWACAAAAGCAVPAATVAFVDRVTRTVIEQFARARAATRHPPRNSLPHTRG